MGSVFATRFASLRTSWGFVSILAASIALWVAGDLLTGFDTTSDGGRFGLLNFLLSVEATLAMPVLYMAIEHAAKQDRAKVDELLRATRELLATLNSVAEDVEEIAQDD